MFSPFTPGRKRAGSGRQGGRARKKIKYEGPIIGHGNYFGPGNSLSKAYVIANPPVDGIDALAKKHDEAYSVALKRGDRPYTQFNTADAALITGLKSNKPGSVSEALWQGAGLMFFGAKKLLASRMNESLNLITPGINKESIMSSFGPTMFKSGLGSVAKYGSFGQDETFDVRADESISYFGFGSLKMPSAIYAYAGETSSEAGYTTHSCSGDVWYHICAALLREILRVEFNGYDISSHDEYVVPRTNLATAVADGYLQDPGFRLNFVKKTEKQGSMPEFAPVHYVSAATPPVYTGTIFSNFKTAQAGQAIPRTFRSLVREIAWLLATNFGVRSIADVSLYGYYVTHPDVVSNTEALTLGRVGPIRRLDNRYFKAYSTAEMMVQNSTVADNATSGDKYDRNRIDVNPLVGCVYKFKHHAPRAALNYVYPSVVDVLPGYTIQPNVNMIAANQGQYNIEFDINQDGMIFPPQSEPAGANWSQLPTRSMFTNITSMEKFGFMPGDMKRMYLKFNFEGTLNSFLRGMNLEVTASASTRQIRSNSLGTSMLIALEKSMSLKSSTGTINTAVQLSYYAGAVFKPARKGVILPMNKDSKTTYVTIADD